MAKYQYMTISQISKREKENPSSLEGTLVEIEGNVIGYRESSLLRRRLWIDQYEAEIRDNQGSTLTVRGFRILWQSRNERNLRYACLHHEPLTIKGKLFQDKDQVRPILLIKGTDDTFPL